MKLNSIIFCEDIRFEQNNKLSLMGIYDQKMIFDLPQNFKEVPNSGVKLDLLLRFETNENEFYPNNFEFEYFVNNESLGKVNNLINFREKTEAMFNITIKSFIPLKSGTLGFGITLYKDKKELFFYADKKVIEISFK